MNKKYIVRLTDAERRELVEVLAKLKGTSQKVIPLNVTSYPLENISKVRMSYPV
jgi:hypothetical protein